MMDNGGEGDGGGGFFNTITTKLLVPMVTMFLTCVWILYITFYNSRVLGSILTWVINKVTKSTTGHIHIGSFSFSVLSGKVMLRDVAYITEDYTFRCQDALIILRWWRPYAPLPVNADASQCPTRLNVFLFGVEFHCYNRSALYSEMERKFGLPPQLIPQSHDKASQGSDGNLSTSQGASSEVNRENIWRDFFGVVKFEITSGRIVFGNSLVPTGLVIGVEELKGTYTTTAPSSPWDLYIHDINCTAEELRVMLAPSKDYMYKIDKPPRFMGEGFVVCKSTKAIIHCYYDEPGLQPSEEETGGEEVPAPCWAMDITCDKSNQITYGPWADKQRGQLQKFFYPQDFKTAIPTEDVQPGQRRQPRSFDLCLNIVSKASLEVLFIKNEETHNFYLEIQKGSYVESSVPLVIGPNGYANKVRGQLLFLESNTNLAFSQFIKSETLEFDVTTHYPLVWNHHQSLEVTLTFSKATWPFIYDHQQFLADIISDWASKEESDLLTFVPSTVNLNLCLKKFEIVLPINQYNWIDTNGQENVRLGLVGDTLDMSIILPSCEYRPDTLPIRVLLRADSAIAMLYLPDCYMSRPCLATLDKSSKATSSWRMDRNAMKIPRDMWRDITDRLGWVEAACAPVVAITILYNYHPVPLDKEVPVIERKFSQRVPRYSTHPPEAPRGGFRKSDIITDPAAELAPNLLQLEVDIGPLSLMAYGSIIQVAVAIKENILGEFQSITPFDGRASQEVPAEFQDRERKINPLGLRHLDVTVSLNIDGIKGHLPVHCSKADEACPVVLMEQLCLELQKTYAQTRLQLLLSPILVTVTDTNQRECPGKHLNQGYLGLSGVQLRCHSMVSGAGLPPEANTVEYAWLVDVQLGSLSGKLSPSQALCLTDAIQLFLHLGVDDMDDLKPIEPLKYCVHMVPQEACTMNETPYGTPCPEEADLKYRMTRLRLSGVQLQIVESDCALDLKVDDVRLASCNAHSRSVKDGLTLTVQDISVHQYVCSPESRQVWLNVGSIWFGPLNVDLVNFITDRAMNRAKRHFLRKHDIKSKRLWFLWSSEELPLLARDGNQDQCGCHGGCLFFTLKRRDSLHRGDSLNMPPGMLWQPESFQGPGRFGESLLSKGKVAFVACDRTPLDSPTKMFKFTRGWVHSSASCSPEEQQPFPLPSTSKAEAAGPSLVTENEECPEDACKSDVDLDNQEKESDGLIGDEKTTRTTGDSVEDGLTTEANKSGDVDLSESRTISVKRATSLKTESEVRSHEVKMTGSSHSLPTTAVQGKGLAVDKRKSSSSESISDSEYFSANEDNDPDRSTKSRTRSITSSGRVKGALSRSTTEGTSVYSSTQSPTQSPAEDATTMSSSLKVESPDRKASVTSTISFTSIKSRERGPKEKSQGGEKDSEERSQHFLTYIPYLDHHRCQEWLKASPSAAESWRATDPYSQPFCGNFLRTGIMSPPQFHVIHVGLGPSMIAERPRDQDLEDIEDGTHESEGSSDDEDFIHSVKDHSTTAGIGTAVKADIKGPINIMLTPMFLDAAHRMLDSAMGSLTGMHPGALLESIHRNSISQAKNTAKKAEKEKQVAVSPSETKLTVIIPQINLCMIQAQPAMTKNKDPTASLLVLHLETLSFNLMTLRSKPLEEEFSPSPLQESPPTHGSSGYQPLLDSTVSSFSLSQAHCQMRRLQEGRNVFDGTDLPTAIPVQCSRVSFCLDPLDFESLKRGLSTSFSTSEDTVQLNITSTIMAEGGIEEIGISLGNGVERMGSIPAGGGKKRKLTRANSREHRTTPPPSHKRKLTRTLSGDQQSPTSQKKGKAKEAEGEQIGQGASSLVIRVDSFWTHVPTPPHPRREQASNLLEFNLLTTASPALDSWLHSASNLKFLFEKTMKSRHQRNIALMTYMMAQSKDSQFKPELPKNKNHYSCNGEAINSDLSCQLVLVLCKDMILMNDNEVEESISIENLPAVTTLENGARALLRQWKVNLMLLNPELSTMNFWNNQGIISSEEEIDRLGTLDSEGHVENANTLVLEDLPSDGSALYGPRTNLDQSDTALPGYKTQSSVQYSMYDEFSDRKKSRTSSGQSSVGEGARSANVSYTRLHIPKATSSTGSAEERMYVPRGSLRRGRHGSLKGATSHGYAQLSDLERVAELSTGSASSLDDNTLEDNLSNEGIITIADAWQTAPESASPALGMSASATQIGNIKVIFKPVLKYFGLYTKDKVSRLKQVVEAVGQLSVSFRLEEFEVCITKTSSKALKDKHAKKLSRGKTFQRRDTPAFSCEDISLRLSIQESLREVTAVRSGDTVNVGSSPGANQEAEISGNIEVVLSVHFGTVLQVVNMAILRLIIQVAQVIKNFQRAKTDLMLKEYVSSLSAEGAMSRLRERGDSLRVSKKTPAHDRDSDVDSVSSRSGSETIPQCWQTMYHLLNLYNEEEEPVEEVPSHIYENPIFMVENETGDPAVFYNRQVSQESSSHEDGSFPAAQKKAESSSTSSSSIGLSVTCSLGVDELCVLAELAGLHLEVEIIPICMGLTASKSLLNHAYPGFVKKLPDISASLQSPSIKAILSKTSKTELMTIGSLTIENPRLSGAMTSKEQTEIHVTSLFSIASVVVDIPLDVTVLTDVAAECSKKLAFRIRQLQQAERSYKTPQNELIPPPLTELDAGVSENSGVDPFSYRNNVWRISNVAKIESISIQATLLPQLFTQYLIEGTCCTFKWNEEGKLFATVPTHTLKFMAKNQGSESSAEIPFPQISFYGDLTKATNGSPEVPLGSRTSGRALMIFKAKLEVESFNHNLTSNLLNHILIVQRILSQELTVLKKELQSHNWPSLENVSSGRKTTSEQPAKRPFCIYTFVIHFKGLQLTACSPSSSAVRLEMGIVELELSNKKENKENKDDTRDSLDDVGGDILIHAKALIELNFALGTLIRNPVFLEADPDFDQVAYFKTKVGLTNSPKGQSSEESKPSSGNKNLGRQTFLVSLIKPVLFLQPHAIDKALMVWMSYKGAYEQFIQQWKDTEDEGIIMGTAPSNSSSQATLPHKRRRAVPINNTLVFQLSVREVAICVPFVQTHQLYASGSKSDLENPAALILSLESTMVSAHYRSSLVTKGVFNAFCLRFTENFQVAMDDWLPEGNGDLYNACCVPHGSFEVGSKVDSDVIDTSTTGLWKVGFRWHMMGLDVKVDPSIGHYLSGLATTLTSIAGTEDIADLTSVTETREGSSNEPLSDQEGKPRRPSTLKLKDDEGKKSNFEIIKELNEQAKVVSDLKTLGATSGTIKEESDRLAKLEAEAQRDAKRAMRKKLFEMGKSMAMREDTVKRKKSPGDKLTPTDEAVVGKRLLERRQTLLEMRKTPTIIPRTTAETTPNLSDVLLSTPFTPTGTPFTAKDRSGSLWWTERKVRRPTLPLGEPRNLDLNSTVGDPSRFQDELMVRRRRFLLQSTQTYEETDSGSEDDLDSGADEADGGASDRTFKEDRKQSGLSGGLNQEEGTGAEAGPMEPEIQLDLDVIINIDSGKISFICYQKQSEDAPEIFFTKALGEKKTGSLPAWIKKAPSDFPDSSFGFQSRSSRGGTFFAIPSVDVKAHYNSQQKGDRLDQLVQSMNSPPSSPRHSRKEVQKRGLVYVWAQMKSPQEEIVVTTSILDFLEQALKVIPPAQESPTVTTPPENPPPPRKDDIDASTNSLVSSSAVDYTTFPVDVIVYFLVQPSIIHLTCLPASRVECLLQLPCTELSFSSTELVDERLNEGEEIFFTPNRTRLVSGPDESLDARKSGNSGLHCSVVLSNFSLTVFHPYGEQLRKDLSQREAAHQATHPESTEGGRKPQVVEAGLGRNALSLELSLVKVNVSRQRSREFHDLGTGSFQHSTPTALPPSSPAKTIINQFSVICDMGSASFQYDMRRLTELLAFPKAWYRKSLAKRMFLGKEARSPDEESYSETDSGSKTDDELSSSTSSEDSFSRVPSRHVKKRVVMPRGSFTRTPAALGTQRPISSDDDASVASTKAAEKRRTPMSKKGRLASLHVRSIQDESELTESLKKQSRGGRPQSPQTPRKDRQPKWKTVVVVAINVDKLDTNINMSNVMGTTVLTVKELRGQSNILMDSNNQRDLHLITNLASLSLEAKGGVVGGLLDTKGLHVEVLQKRLREREPHHNIKVGVESFASRLDYMGSSSLLANLTGLQLSERDEWKCTMKGKERHLESMYTNTAIMWDNMHLIICRSTTPDILKAANRLEEFVTQQLKSSKKMLSSWKPPSMDTGRDQGGTTRPRKRSSTSVHRHTSGTSVKRSTSEMKGKLKKQVSLRVTEATPDDIEEGHWHTIFKWCSSAFGSRGPSRSQGPQLGGQVTLQGKKAVVTCFHGLNFRSSSWALFTLREPHIQFETNAFEVPPESGQGEGSTLVAQNLTFDLGHNQTQREGGWMAMIHRVYRNEKSHFPFSGSIAEAFQYVSAISCPDEAKQFMNSQEFFPPMKSSSYKHRADPIFALPKLQLVMDTKQELAIRGSIPADPTVQVTFVTTFTDHLYVSMDVELLLFLHDMVIAYMEYKDKAMSLQHHGPTAAIPKPPEKAEKKEEGPGPKTEEKKESSPPPSPSKDRRQFNCTTWQLEPTVRLLSWGGKQIEPVGADYILHKLGFKHARITIPKWIQRGVMDPSDIAVSLIVREMLKMMVERKDEKDEKKKKDQKT